MVRSWKTLTPDHLLKMIPNPAILTAGTCPLPVSSDSLCDYKFEKEKESGKEKRKGEKLEIIGDANVHHLIVPVGQEINK